MFVACGLFVVFSGNGVLDAAQSDDSFREFQRDMVPTPQELFRQLEIVTGTENGFPQSIPGIDPSTMNQLQKLGQEFLANLSPAEREQAQAFADKFMAENGLESEQAKAMMERFGIPQDVQKGITDQYKKLETEQGKQASFSDLLRQSGWKSQSATGKQNGERSGSSSGVNEKQAPWNTSRGDSERLAPGSGEPTTLDDLVGTSGPGAGSTPNAQSSKNYEDMFRGMLKGAKKTLSNSEQESGSPKLRLTSRFDQLIVKAVKRSLESKSGESSDFSIDGSVDSIFDKMIDQVHSAVKDQKQKRAATTRNLASKANRQGGIRNFENPVRSSRSSGDDPFPNANSSSSKPWVGQFPEVTTPGFSQHFFRFVCAGAILLIVYLVWRQWNGSPESKVRSRFSRRFAPSKIKSPQDLIEAVDYLLIKRFGAESGWWHAQHARSRLCAESPQAQAKISELFTEYIRARYMRPDTELSAGWQERFKPTLRELAAGKKFASVVDSIPDGSEI